MDTGASRLCAKRIAILILTMMWLSSSGNMTEACVEGQVVAARKSWATDVWCR
ncbi:hypothetical protein KCP75_23930 [Salmonella enterica subsp. enterica]|nr:hypothetical protein KCP75_23930 [Salmonella enterica subsp. enterica]